ncbi:MAG: recombinase family protein [Patescibacteria group bacterium]
MRYIAYCRKSTDEKDRQLLSIEAQIAELQEFAKREQLEVIEYITEAKTAKCPGREQFATVLKRIENGEAQGILAWHADRLARNSIDGGRVIYLLDTGKLLDLKFPTLWFENTPQGKFMLSIAFGQSKYYVDNLSENIKRGLRQKLRNGVWPTKAPIGYRNDKDTRTVEVDTEESKVVKKAFQMFAEGGVSFAHITRFLHRFEITGSTGKPMKIEQVKTALSNTFYIGLMKYNGELYEGKHKLFISKDVFQRAQQHIKKIERPRYNGHRFIFAGLARCGECGAAITAEIHKKYYRRTERAAEYIYYRCTKKLKPCVQKYIQEPDIEAQLRKTIASVALPQDWGREWLAWLDRDEIIEKQMMVENLEKLKQESEAVEKKLTLLLDSYLDQVVDSDTYKQKKNELFEQKLKFQEQITKIKETGSAWLEPFREFIYSALSCEKIARAKNNGEEVANFAKTVGSNFFLKDRQLAAEFKEPYLTLCAPLPAQSHLTGSAEKSDLVLRTGVEPV